MSRTPPDRGLRLVKTMRPSVPTGFVRRPHLDDLLDAGTRRRLTLVSAGPGWGKTLTVAAWADSLAVGGRPRTAGEPPARHVAWLTLDEDDDEAGAFWNSVLAALRSSGVLPPANPLSTVSLGPRLTADVMVRLYQGLVDLTSPVVLVLDDFHVIADDVVLEAVAALARMNLSLHLVLVTRHDPVLPLHRLRAEGELSEIRAAQLTFDVAAADLLLRRSGQELPSSEVARLVEHTEGWAVGLRLASLWLAETPAGTSVEQFEGDHRAVAEYLLIEVLDAQEPEARDFLLRTSIVPRICGALADELVDTDTHGGGRQRLEQLVKDNTFVTALGVGGEWFRYHPLLREMLASVLAAEHPEGVATLHRTASRWFSRHGEPLDSLRHAAAARDWALVGSVFVSDGSPLILTNARNAVDAILETVPESVTAGSPTLLLAAAVRALNALRIDDLLHYTDQAARLLDSADPSDRVGARLTLYAVQGAAYRVQGGLTALLDVTARTLDLLDEHPGAVRYADHFRAIALNNRAVALVWSGRLDEAYDALAEAWPVVEASGLVLTHVNVLGHLSLIALCRGRLGDAEDYAQRGLELARAHGAQSVLQSATSHLVLGVVQLVRGRLVEAERTLQDARLATHGHLEPAVGLATHVALALAAVARGRPQEARRAARVADEMAARWKPPAELAGWVTGALVHARLVSGDPAGALGVLQRAAGTPSGPELLACAVVQLALGQLDEADAALAPLRDDDGGRGEVGRVGAHVVTALVEERRDRARALDAMRTALRAAVPQRVILPFLIDAPRTAGLLRQVASGQDAESAFAAEVVDVCEPFRTPSGSEPAPLVEVLTDRELTVLRYLPSMRSNTEISTEMFVSVNTVKAHLKSLYRKLDVASRREAVRRGQSLGLVR